MRLASSLLPFHHHLNRKKLKRKKKRNCQYLIRPPGDPAAEEWSQWSVCSLTCGQGWQVRTRSCVSSPYGTLCSGALRETRMCNNTASCPGEHGITGSGTSAAPGTVWFFARWINPTETTWIWRQWDVPSSLCSLLELYLVLALCVVALSVCLRRQVFYIWRQPKGHTGIF